jgi:hypothetical protein
VDFPDVDLKVDATEDFLVVDSGVKIYNVKHGAPVNFVLAFKLISYPFTFEISVAKGVFGVLRKLRQQLLARGRLGLKLIL